MLVLFVLNSITLTLYIDLNAFYDMYMFFYDYDYYLLLMVYKDSIVTYVVLF